MRAQTLVTALINGALAARPWLNEPDTGIDDVLGDLPEGTLPDLSDMVGLPDFDWAARHYLPLRNYTYYRNGAAGEWSYRNNLEVFQRYRLRPRVMVDITNIESTLPYVTIYNFDEVSDPRTRTTILGHNFSAPFFISPCARGAYGHPEAELNFVRGAAAGDILYMVRELQDMVYFGKQVIDSNTARTSSILHD